MEGCANSIDLSASLSKLSAWLKKVSCAQAGSDFRAKASRYKELADQLRTVAGELCRDEWFFLEEAFNENPPPGIGGDGMPIPYPWDNAGRYQGLSYGLRELAEVAERLAGECPKPRTRPVLPLAGRLFLLMWLEAGEARPALSNASPAVLAFKRVLDDAGMCLSEERVRGILSGALDAFDPYLADDRAIIDDLMVVRQ